MTHATLFLAVILGLTSCGQNAKVKSDNNELNKAAIQTDTTTHAMTDINEKWTIYFHQDTIYHVKRLIVKNNHFYLLNYDINTSQPENAGQKFIEDKPIADLNEAEKIKSDNTNYNWKPYKTANQTLFVQIESSAFKDAMSALNKRQEIEQKIESALKLNNNGEWTAGDLGPGGANMLFEVKNIDTAIPIIIDVLFKEGFDKKTVIGRRVNESEEDWFYEVIYPLNFGGQFLTM